VVGSSCRNAMRGLSSGVSVETHPTSENDIKTAVKNIVAGGQAK
jgi:hypothetical protein